MNSSLKLFSVRGIDIRLHITFPLILIWAALQFGWLAGGGVTGAVFGVIVISLLFVLVTLHELGHSFAAQQFGVPVERIVLMPIGGVAQLKHIPRNPRQEFIIAVAGPAVNVVLALMMWLVAQPFGLELFNPMVLLSGVSTLSLSAIFSYVFFYNITLAVFNMLPAFPMDGGRILRSLLAMRLNYGRATHIASSIGRGLAVLLGIYAFFNGAIFLIFIAFFIYTGALQEGRMVQQYEKMRGLKVQDAYFSQVQLLSPADSLQTAMMLKLRGWQSDFPVFENGRLVGYLTDHRLMNGLTQYGPNTRVSAVMAQDVAPVSPSSELFDVQQRMQAERMGSLPVMDGPHFVGMVTYYHIRELLRSLAVGHRLQSNPQSA